jgi:hypothetical protein
MTIDHACHEHCLQSVESAVDKALRVMEEKSKENMTDSVIKLTLVRD